MEPFNLSLSQVNIEEQELGESADYETLYSFSNLVSYDSDFRDEEGTHSIPVLAKMLKPHTAALHKRVKASEDVTATEIIQSEASERYLHNYYKLRHATQESAPDGVPIASQIDIDMQMYRQHKLKYTKHHDAEDARSPPNEPNYYSHAYPKLNAGDHVIEANTAHMSSREEEDANADTSLEFKAFTDTVEALALQQSVIGKRGIQPASAEEIAAAIAATRQRMIQAGQISEQSDGACNIAAIAAQVGTELAQAASHSQHSDSTEKTSDNEAPTQHSSQPLTALDVTDGGSSLLISMTHGDEDVIVREYGGADSGELQHVLPQGPPQMSTPKHSPDRQLNGSLNSTHPELIRIPPNEIVTVIEKNKSWFSSSKVTTKGHSTSPIATSKGQPLSPIATFKGVNTSPKTTTPNRDASQLAVHSKATSPMATTSVTDTLPSTTVHASASTKPNQKTDMPVTDEVSEATTMEKTKPHAVTMSKSPVEEVTQMQKTYSVDNEMVTSSATTPKTKDKKKSSKAKMDKSSTKKKQQGTPAQNTESVSIREFAEGKKDLNLAENKATPVNVNVQNIHESNSQDNNEVGGVAGPTKDSVDNSTHIKSAKSPSPGKIRRLADQVDTVYEEGPDSMTLTVLGDNEPNNGSSIFTAHKGSTLVLATPKNLSAESLAQEVERLLRERAKLEGHIEVLDAECTAALRERAQLQSQVAAVTQQLSCQEGIAKTVQQERDALSADYETLRQNRGRLEQVIIDAKRLMDDKDSDIAELKEDLRQARLSHQQASDALKALQTQLANKDTTITDLKTKIAQLYVDFQTAEQNHLLVQSEVTSLVNERRTLETSKQWYSEQLTAAQEAKAQLQHDMTRLKSEMISQATLIERTRADNVRLQQRLTDAEQRALVEKEQLARHLEAIEADMMEREAMFAQIKHQQVSMETLLASAQHSEPEPAVSSEDVTRLENEIRRLQAQCKTTETQFAEISGRLALAQESILERDRELDSEQQKAMQLETDLRQARADLEHSQVDMDALNQAKLSLERELAAARQDKEEFDANITNLKSDMGRVEANFRAMRTESASRQEQLEAVTAERDQLRAQLVSSAGVHRVSTHEVAVQHDSESPVQTDYIQQAISSREVADLTETVSKLEEEKVQLRTCVAELQAQIDATLASKTQAEQDLGLTQARLQHMEDRVRQLTQDRADMEGQLLKAAAGQASEAEELASLRERLQKTELELQDERTRVERSLQEVTLTLEQTQTELQDKQREHSQQMEQLQQTMQEQEMALNQALEAAEARVTELDEDLRSTEQKAKDEVAALQQKLLAAQERETKEREGYEGRLGTLMAQLEEVRVASGDRAQMEHTLQEQSIKLKQIEHNHKQEREEYELHLQEANLALMTSEAARKDEEKAHRDRLRALQAELADTLDKLQHALSDTYIQEAVGEKTAYLDTRIADLTEEIDILREDKSSLEHRLEEVTGEAFKQQQEYTNTKQALAAELAALRAELEDTKGRSQDARQLALELEKERGRLAGLQQTYNSLREHSSRVEAALAARESSVMELSSHADSELLRQSRELSTLTERLAELEAVKEDQQQQADTLKQQLLTEKENHGKVRRELEKIQTEHTSQQADLEKQQLDLESVTKELERASTREQHYKEQLEKATTQVQSLREDKDDLVRQVTETTAKDGLLHQQIQSLEWQLGEKQSEVTALKEQVQIVEDRQHMELTSLQTHLQSSQADLLALRTELSSIKRERNTLQAKVAELKSALRASVKHASLQKDASPGSMAAPFDTEFLDSLLKDVAPVTEQSKPLSVLQSTLSGLRGQISSLQSQVDQHTSAVQTSSLAWKELEAQVHDLREVCKSSAAERAASQSLLDTTLQLTAAPGLPGLVDGTSELPPGGRTDL